MFIITGAAAILAIIFAVSAAALFLMGRHRPIETMLEIYLIFGAIWIGGNALADISRTPELLFIVSGIAFVGGSMVLPCMLTFIDLLIDEQFPPLWRFLIYALPNTVLSLMAFSSYGVISMSFPPGAPSEIVPGIIYTIVFFTLFGGLIYGSVRLFLGLRAARGEKRMQILYVATGVLIMLAGDLVFDVLLPLRGELRFYTLGPVMSVFFAAACAYAITKHHLLDIRVVIERSAFYAVLVAFVTACYLAVLNGAGALFGIESHLTVLAALITTLVGVFTVPMLESYFRKLTDRIFFQGRYDYAEATRAVSEVLYRGVELNDLVARSEETLARILRAASVRVLLNPDPLISGALSIPIALDGRAPAAIYLGPKRSGDPYTARDLQLLETFAYQAATAFSRALLYEQVKRHAADLAQRVAERTDELRRAQERERQMLFDISHGLQTPLTLFKLKLEDLKRAPAQRPDLRLLERWLDDVSAFLYRLLSLARLESGDTASYAPLDLSALVESVIEEGSVIAEASSITLAGDVAPGLNIEGDEQKLREALMNIVSNAIAYMRPRGTREIRITLVPEEGSIALAVADTGIGIRAADLGRIFDRFYRVEHSQGAPGTGLGLSIAKSVVEQHGGSISVASEFGKGTRVTLAFPNTRPYSRGQGRSE